MDPASIIGLVGTVIQLVEVTKKVIDVLATIKDCDNSLIHVCRDLNVFNEALLGFTRVLRGKRSGHRLSEQVVHDLIDHSNTTLEGMRSKFVSIATLERSTLRRLVWVRQKSAIEKLHWQLKEQITMLHTFLSIAHAETFMEVVKSVPQFMLSDHDSSNAAPLEAGLQADDNPSEGGLLQVPSHASTSRRLSIDSFQSIESTSASTVSSVDRLSIASSVKSFDTWSSRSSTSTTTKCSQKGADETLSASSSSLTRFQPVSQDMFLIRRSCRYDCHCVCHRPPETRTGFRNIQKQTISQCTETRCKGNNLHSEGFPQHSKSFRKALFQSLTSRSIHVRYDLKTYRMVPEGIDAMRHVKHGSLQKLRLCIESGEATIHDTAPDGWSLLHTAAYNRQLDIVKYLLQLGADTGVGDVGSRTPADLAVLKSIGQDATEVERMIFDTFNQKDDVLQDFDFTPIHIAALKLYDANDEERPSLEALIQLADECNNAPPSTNWTQRKEKYAKRSPLFSGIIEYYRASAYEQPKDAKIIHHLLDRRDKKYHWTPLHWAASAGRVEEMRTLVMSGADPVLLSNLDANILHAAAESKTDQGLRGALKIWKQCPERLNINQANRWQETPLHVASWCSAACVRLLLDAGADPSFREENGQVPLHCAGLSGKSAERQGIVSLLCSSASGSDHINVQDFDGRPPLFDFLDDPDCVELLVNNGARLDLSDSSGNNVFHHVCIQGETETLSTLLQLPGTRGLAPLSNDHGNTPLFEALSASNIGCAILMLGLDEVGNPVDSDGWGPIHHAAKIGDLDLLESVIRHPSFEKGMKTLDGKGAHVVAMEAGNWEGEIQKLIRQADGLVWID